MIRDRTRGSPRALAIALGLLIGGCVTAVNRVVYLNDGAPPLPAMAPLAEAFVIVPLRAYVSIGNEALTAPVVPSVVGALNRIFFPAGLQFVLDGPAQTVGVPFGNRFDAALAILPPRDTPLLRVAFVPRLFYDNGEEQGGDLVVRERAVLRLAAGPSVDPIARVTGHLIGAALGLRPSPDPLQLMAMGTTGVALDAAQAAVLRAAARRLPGSIPFAQAARSGRFPEVVGFIRANAPPG